MSSLKLRELVSLGAVVGLSAGLIGTSYAATDSVSEVSQLTRPSRIVGAAQVDVSGAGVEIDVERVAKEIQSVVQQFRENPVITPADPCLGGFDVFE
jgi:hypothetical protein